MIRIPDSQDIPSPLFCPPLTGGDGEMKKHFQDGAYGSDHHYHDHLSLGYHDHHDLDSGETSMVEVTTTHATTYDHHNLSSGETSVVEVTRTNTTPSSAFQPFPNHTASCSHLPSSHWGAARYHLPHCRRPV